MNCVSAFERELSPVQRRTFESLSTLEKIQKFLDNVRYCGDSQDYLCPLTLFRKNIGCCFEGALLAAIAFAKIGLPPLIIELTSHNDDDHVLAVYKKNGLWGAVAKSVFPGLRSRQPVYRTLRELAMSYFESYFNRRRQFTMRAYSLPVDLRRFDRIPWAVTDRGAQKISKALDAASHMRLFPSGVAKNFGLIDKWAFEAGIAGSSRRHLHR